MKKIKLAFLFPMLMLFTTGCIIAEDVYYNQQNETYSERTESIDYEGMLSSAKNIEIKKSMFSMNSKYSVTVDNRHFGTVQGKYINVTGDVFKLIDNDGNTIGLEKQIKRWSVKLNRMAEVKDNNDLIIGYIGEENIKDLFKYGKVFHFYNADKEQVAQSDEVFFSLTKAYKVKDNDGNVLYEINQNLMSLTNTFTIKVHNSKVVPVEQIIYLTCILDAINSSENDE